MKNKLSGLFDLKVNATCMVVLIAILLSFNMKGVAQSLTINDSEYFEMTGLNVLVYSNEFNGEFFDEKTAGIGMIHHGVRTVQGGAVRLQNTPEQWDLIPKMLSRTVDKDKGTIEVKLRYEEYDFETLLKVKSRGEGFDVTVILDEVIPAELEGKVGFNLEFLPSTYFESNYLIDGKPGTFPRYPASNTQVLASDHKIPQFAGHNTFDDRGRDEFIVPLPIAKGQKIIFAPENSTIRIKVESDTELKLYDGRNLAQNGWFVLRSTLPSGKKDEVLTWYVEPSTIPEWTRDPVIGFSQVGYMPAQEKVAVLELDPNQKVLPSASIVKLNEKGEAEEKLKVEVKEWGKYLRYNYALADFSSLDEPGIYFIQYGEHKTNTFHINEGIYSKVWHPTMDVFFPIQMDHMEVNEGYRTWHGKPFADDCLQAPLNHEHFDGYSQGSTTDTKYKPLERIPGMSVGGWFDAGDFDIQTFRHVLVISSFVESWETFQINRDQTYIDQKTQYVDIHRPDGQPDILQQIEHGVLNLVAQVENIGHPVRGIVVPNLHQYHHLGDASIETDNLPYNSALKPYETDGKSSGTLDDRWAFTNRSSFLDYRSAGALAAASRALKGYNDELSEKCISIAKSLFAEARELEKSGDATMSRWGRGSDAIAMLQLFLATKEKEYKDGFLDNIWKMLDENIDRNINYALLALPQMDKEYKSKLRGYITKYKASQKERISDNPYAVPIVKRGWGGSSTVINWSITNYYIYKAFPDMMSEDEVYRGLNFIFGCHPYSNLSFVNAVGNNSKKVAYGSNRADFTTIAGGVVPGLIFLEPDYLENKDDWPFFWGQNECIIDGGAWYIFLANAADELSRNKP